MAPRDNTLYSYRAPATFRHKSCNKTLSKHRYHDRLLLWDKEA